MSVTIEVVDMVPWTQWAEVLVLVACGNSSCMMWYLPDCSRFVPPAVTAHACVTPFSEVEIRAFEQDVMLAFFSQPKPPSGLSAG